jgi:hypothetical protein
MKKTFQHIAILAFISFLTACSDDNSLDVIVDGDGVNSVLQERTVSIVESEQFDTSSGNSIRTAVSYLENGKTQESLNYREGTLELRVVYEYNSLGLVNRVLYFDGNNTSLSNRDYSIVYDAQRRVRNIVYANHIVEFTYNADNTVTRRAFDSANPEISTATYYMNDNNQVTRFETSFSSTTFEFEYVNNKLVGAAMDTGFSNVDVEYGYDDFQETRGFTYHKFYKNMFGQANNAVFTSERSIENMISLYYGEENPSMLAYYIDNPLQELVTQFVYTRDAENYVTEFDMIANGSLYTRIKITYED